MTPTVRCPDCGEGVAVPPGARPGDVLECPACAGHALRLRRDDEGWTAALAHRVSCPACEEALVLPEGARAGDTVECCGRRYRLTFEYGAFAAEAGGVPRAAGRPVLASLSAWAGAGLASLCCLLPLLIIGLGLGSGAFMAVTMSYRWLLIPAGVLGVAAGFVVYLRERRRCRAPACRMAGGRVTLGLLILAGVVVAAAIALDQLPEVTSDLIGALAERGGELPRQARRHHGRPRPGHGRTADRRGEPDRFHGLARVTPGTKPLTFPSGERFRLCGT